MIEPVPSTRQLRFALGLKPVGDLVVSLGEWDRGEINPPVSWGLSVLLLLSNGCRLLRQFDHLDPLNRTVAETVEGWLAEARPHLSTLEIEVCNTQQLTMFDAFLDRLSEVEAIAAVYDAEQAPHSSRGMCAQLGNVWFAELCYPALRVAGAFGPLPLQRSADVAFLCGRFVEVGLLKEPTGWEKACRTGDRGHVERALAEQLGGAITRRMEVSLQATDNGLIAGNTALRSRMRRGLDALLDQIERPGNEDDAAFQSAADHWFACGEVRALALTY